MARVIRTKGGFPLVKNPAGNAGSTEEVGLIPESGRSLEKEMVSHSSILAWEIPRREEPSGLRSMESDTAELTNKLRLRRVMGRGKYTHREMILH